MLNHDPSGFAWRESDDRTVVSGQGLRLIFAREGDRWTHHLELERPSEGEPALLLARAVELDPERDDPARVLSPLYQELHRHDLAEGPGLFLLLTGRLFHHHFSAAVHLRGDRGRSDGFGLDFDFDVADRCRAPVTSLAATYAVGLGGGTLIDAGPDRIAWSLPGAGGGLLELLAEAPTVLALAEAGRRTARVQALATIEPGTFTQRLRYRWRWTTSSDRTR